MTLMATDNEIDTMINYLSAQYKVPREEVVPRILSAMVQVDNMDADLIAEQRAAKSNGLLTTRYKLEWWK